MTVGGGSTETASCMPLAILYSAMKNVLYVPCFYAINICIYCIIFSFIVDYIVLTSTEDTDLLCLYE